MSKPIHQEVVFAASADRIYSALTDSDQFTAVSGGAPAEINSEVGGGFSCFGGQIVGRTVELVPNQRIVQEWRATSWDESVVSRVTFELQPDEDGTRLVLEHADYPEGESEHLSGGWHKMYWEPLRDYLAK